MRTTNTLTQEATTQDIAYYQEQLLSARKSLDNYQEYVNEEMIRFQLKLQSKQAILNRLERELAAAQKTVVQETFAQGTQQTSSNQNSQQVEFAA